MPAVVDRLDRATARVEQEIAGIFAQALADPTVTTFVEDRLSPVEIQQSLAEGQDIVNYAFQQTFRATRSAIMRLAREIDALGEQHA